jgi:hypothetical protein
MPKRLVQSSVIYRDLHRQCRRLCLTRAQADELVAMQDGAIGAVLARL